MPVSLLMIEMEEVKALGLKVADPEESLWLDFKKVRVQSITELENRLLIEKALLEFVSSKLEVYQ